MSEKFMKGRIFNTRKQKILGRFSILMSLSMLLALFPVNVSAAQTVTTDQTGEHGGFYYSFWNQGGGSVVMTLGDGGNYSVTWSNCSNFTCGKGWRTGSANKVVNFTGTFNGGNNGYLALYGWTKNPLIEYYVIEDYGQWTPPGVASIGTLNSDGGTYTIHKATRYNQPSIVGTATFDQFFSVRQQKRSSGTITFANHVNGWRNVGLNLGSTWDYLIMETEGYQSSGNANITVSDGGAGGSQQQGQQQWPQDQQGQQQWQWPQDQQGQQQWQWPQDQQAQQQQWQWPQDQQGQQQWQWPQDQQGQQQQWQWPQDQQGQQQQWQWPQDQQGQQQWQWPQDQQGQQQQWQWPQDQQGQQQWQWPQDQQGQQQWQWPQDQQGQQQWQWPQDQQGQQQQWPQQGQQDQQQGWNQGSNGTGFKINVSSVKGNVGEQITVPINFENLPSGGVATADMTINYDSSKLEYVGSEAGSIVKNAGTNFAINKVSDGELKVLFLDYTMSSEAITSEGVFVNLTFRVKNSGSANINVTNVTVGDQALKSVSTQVNGGVVSQDGSSNTQPAQQWPQDQQGQQGQQQQWPQQGQQGQQQGWNQGSNGTGFKINVSSVKANVGEQITVPVNFENLPSGGVATADMTINYDSNKLEYLGSEAGSIVKNAGTNFAINKVSDGELKVLFLDYTMSSEAITSEGVFVNLTFRVKNSGSANISVTNVTVGDQALKSVSTQVNGGVVSQDGSSNTQPAQQWPQDQQGQQQWPQDQQGQQQWQWPQDQQGQQQWQWPQDQQGQQQWQWPQDQQGQQQWQWPQDQQGQQQWQWPQDQQGQQQWQWPQDQQGQQQWQWSQDQQGQQWQWTQQQGQQWQWF
jgi:hypothetical protein